MANLFLDPGHIAIILFSGAIIAILFRWLVLTEDRRKYRDYLDGGMWTWIAFSTAMYVGEAHALGHDGFDGAEYGDGAGGDFGGGCGGGCGGGGA